ncbi:MAG: nucleotidyltransferase family protein, partial [Terriglobia bacterium]
MNPACASEIVKYLHVSGSPEVDFSRLKVSHDHWKRTLEWLDHSGIALLFWNRLKVRGDAAAIPSEVAERLERNLADHRLRLSEMAAEFDSINQCFEGARLKYAAMKGLALAPDYCPDIALRTTYDYDYLLPRGSMQAAEEALRSAGYVWKRDPEEHPVVYCHAARPPCNPLSRDDLYSKDFPRTVELHYLFWDAAPVKIPLTLPADPLADLEIRHVRVLPNHPGPSRPGRPLHFYALSEDNDLIFQVLHAFRHILHGWCRLCSLLDVAYFLEHRRLDAAFWDRFIGRLRDNRPLSEIVGVVFLLAA